MGFLFYVTAIARQEYCRYNVSHEEVLSQYVSSCPTFLIGLSFLIAITSPNCGSRLWFSRMIWWDRIFHNILQGVMLPVLLFLRKPTRSVWKLYFDRHPKVALLFPEYLSEVVSASQILSTSKEMNDAVLIFVWFLCHCVNQSPQSFFCGYTTQLKKDPLCYFFEIGIIPQRDYGSCNRSGCHPDFYKTPF